MKSTIIKLFWIAIAALPAMAQIDVNAGTVTVAVLYQGQEIPSGCWLYFASASNGFGCGSTAQNVPTGNYTLTEIHGYPFAPIPFTVSAGQTTTVNVEISPYVGIIRGKIQVNGQAPNPPLQVRTQKEDGFDYTDNLGDFDFIALAGTGTGSISNGLGTFPFTAVAGQTVDVGTITKNTGSVTVTVLYQGQEIPSGCWLYFASASNGFGCGGSAQNVPTGNYTLTEAHGYPFAPIPFTVSAGQTTAVNVEISPYVGIIKGRILVNGQAPNPPLQVRTQKEDGFDYTDNVGDFDFIALAGTGTGTISNGLGTFPFTAAAGQTVDVGTITKNSGSVTVAVLYQGQEIPSGCWLYFASASNGFGCGSTAQNVPTGNYTLTEIHGYPFAPIPFTVSAGQTTTVNVETSPYVGIIKGKILVNGQTPNPPLQVRTQKEDGFDYTDNLGNFDFIALAGPGIGTISNGLGTFAFNAVAGQTRDLGTIGSTTLTSAIVGKSGPLSSKTWSIKISNTGVNASANTRLDNVQFVQTAGTACNAPVVSAMPVNAGLLAPGTNATVQTNINFGNCAANTKFTVTIYYSGNSGTATAPPKVFTLQQP